METWLAQINWALIEEVVRYGVAMYLVVPLFVFSRIRIPRSPALQAVDWDDFLATRSSDFRSLHRQLCELGFHPAAGAIMRSSNSTLPFALYTRAGDATVATLMAGRNTQGEDTILEYLQLFDSGRVLSLSNARTVGIYPNWERKIKFRLADARSAAELHSVFRSIVADVPAQLQAIPLPQEDPLAVVRRHIEEENDYMRSRGYFACDSRTNEMRPTLKGAFLFSWRLTWPFSWLAKRRAAPPDRYLRSH